MSKFAYFQDAHIKGVNSRNRLNNYFEDCLLKLDEILDIAQKEQVDAILEGGDIFETFEPSYRIIDEICDRVEKVKIPIYSLFGNHAMYYKHIENSRYTGLAHLQKRSSYFKYFNRIEDKDFIIEALDYKVGIEDELKQKTWTITCNPDIHKDEPIWRIGVIHAMITPKPFFKDVAYVLPEQIKTNADLVLCSHYHHPFKQIIGNTTFLNIGCLGRDNINEAKIEPSILLIDTDKRNAEIIKLKSAKPAEKIFDLTKYEELKENEKSIEDFINALNSAEWSATNLESQIEVIGKQEGIEQGVIDYLQKKIVEIKLGGLK